MSEPHLALTDHPTPNRPPPPFSSGSGFLAAAGQHLPAELTPLIGREGDVDQLFALLRLPAVRLVTLVGPGGVGKTRLAAQVARRLHSAFRDGVSFVSLASISEPCLVVPMLAHALQVHDRHGSSLLEQVQDALHNQHTLLVLDNFEHLLQATPLLEDLLVACPALTLLVTSRAALRLRAERQFPVAPLALPDLRSLPACDALAQNPSVALFLERAQAVVPTFHLTPTNAQVVAEICVQVDGLPLALELAAARIKVLPPQALLARLHERLTLLTDGSCTLPERQQTLRNTLAWSYALLSPQEQRLFRLLSVFVGGCTLEAVEAVAVSIMGKQEALLDTMTALVDKSLLVATGPAGEEPRFGMLETMRAYGLEALDAHGEREASQQAHAAYYLDLAEQAAHQEIRGQQAKWLTRREQEQANLRAALAFLRARGETQALLRLAGALWRHWTILGARFEALSWLQQALALPGAEAPTAARARALCGLGFLTAYLLHQGAEGLASLEESCALSAQLGDQEGMAVTLGWAAQVQLYRANYPAAERLAEQGLTLSRALGERGFSAFHESILALLAEKQGDEARAVIHWEQVRHLMQTFENHPGFGTRTLRHLAALAFARGNLSQAHALLEENLMLARQTGYAGAVYWSLAGLATLACLAGDYARAENLCAEGLTLAHQAGDRYATSRLLSIQGQGAQAQGQVEQAKAIYRDALRLAVSIAASEPVGHCLLGLAQLAYAEGTFQHAALLYAAALPRLSHSLQLTPTERATCEHHLADLRARLEAPTSSRSSQGGEAVFACLWAQGQALTLEQTLQVALTDPVPSVRAADPARISAQATTPSVLPVSQKRTVLPAGLSTRQAEVLRLVTEGQSNRAIADALDLSEKTVINHLTSIFQKIGCDNRAAAVAFAIRQGLA
ncbi:MAG TPA: LuxR C-terminal-related transcriptional regulator [Ktedonobacterales bacterium]